MDFDTLCQTLRSWSSAAPARAADDLHREMQRFARALMPADALLLAKSLVELEARDPRLAGVLADLLDEYARLHPEELGDALLHALSPGAPPSLVDALGTTGIRRAVPVLAELFRVSHANVELQVAAASAMGMIGGDEAARALTQLRGRADLHASVHEEIDIALSALRGGK